MSQSLWRLHRIWHNEKNTERQKTSFPKESLKNTNLYKRFMVKPHTSGILIIYE